MTITIVSGPPCPIVCPSTRVELLSNVAVEVTSDEDELAEPEPVAEASAVIVVAEKLVLAVLLTLLLLLLLLVVTAWRCSRRGERRVGARSALKPPPSSPVQHFRSSP